jgi:hypothetical protein
VRPNLAALLEHDGAHFLPGLGLELFEADGGAEARRTAADDFFPRFRVGVVQCAQGRFGMQEARAARKARMETGEHRGAEKRVECVCTCLCL